MMTTLAIVGVLTASTVGSLGVIQQTRQTTALNDLVTRLALGRSESIKRDVNTVFCPSTTGDNCTGAGGDFTWWHNGAILFIDSDGDRNRDTEEPIIQVYNKLEGITVKTTTNRKDVRYNGRGHLSGTNTTFTFCDPHGSVDARYVIVSMTGRARVSSKPPDGAADTASELCP